jgi:hypothetical protein
MGSCDCSFSLVSTNSQALVRKHEAGNVLLAEEGHRTGRFRTKQKSQKLKGSKKTIQQKNEDNTGRNDRNRGQENEVSLILNESESSMDLSLPPGHAFASFSS